MTVTSVLVLILFLMESLAAEVPNYTLNNGVQIPAIALGSYLGFIEHSLMGPKKKQMKDAVLLAIDLGYRHFDTAKIYETESDIGEALKIKIDQGAVRREDVFITTKLWNNQHRRSQVTEALMESLKKLDLKYVDLYLIHWPMGINEDQSYYDTDYMETWAGMEDVLRLGLTRAIGVSNFNKDQLSRVLKEGTIRPAVLQIEVHPQMAQKQLVKFAQSEGIVVMGYSPLGSLVSRWGLEQFGPHIDDPLLVRIAKKYGKTTPQIVLRWLVEQKIIPIPKAVTPRWLREDIDIFNFNLTDTEMAEISRFNSNTKFTLPSFWQDHPYYPFDKVENPIENPF